MTDKAPIKLASPPLVEALIGIQSPLNPGFSGFLLGGFWAKVRDAFPKPSLREAQGDQPKVKLVSARHDFILQILDSGFYLSWVACLGGDPYPGFSSLLKRFQELYRQYAGFLAENDFPVPPISGLSMGYTNVIGTPPDVEGLYVPKVFPDFSWRPVDRNLSPPAFVNLGTVFQFPEERCLVDARIDGPFPPEEPDGDPLLKFYLQARGVAEPDADMDVVWEWYPDAKVALNRTFTGLTSADFRREYLGEEN